jgi:GntR family transcriptional regulator of gluconate operon
MSHSVRVGSLGQLLAKELRVQILRGALRQGSHLVEDVLAEQYDVSRGPVRDALAELAREGLVRRQRRGFVVSGFGANDVAELYSLRASLEALALDLAMESRDPEAWRRLEDILAGMEAAAEAGQSRRYAGLDIEFHNEFYVLSGNSRLAAAWQPYSSTFGAVMDLTNQQDADLRPSFADHRDLLEAARAGERVRAQELLSNHLIGSKHRIVRALRQATYSENAHGTPSEVRG